MKCSLCKEKPAELDEFCYQCLLDTLATVLKKSGKDPKEVIVPKPSPFNIPKGQA